MTLQIRHFMAAYLGLALSFYSSMFEKTLKGIPLYEFSLMTEHDRAISAFAFMVTLIFAFKPSYLKWFMGFSIVVISAIYNSRYSGFSSVTPFLPFGFLFLLLFSNEKQTSLSQAARILLFTLFLASALHKLNASYLRGDEFTRFDGVLGWFIIRGFSMWNLLPHSMIKLVALLGIITELLLAALILVRPRAGTIGILIFTLALSLIHPPVIFVHLCILPFLFLVDQGPFQRIQTRLGLPLWALTLIWFCLITLFLVMARNSLENNLLWAAFSLCTITIWFKPIELNFKLKWIEHSKAFSNFTTKKMIWVLILLFYSLTPLFGAPPPMGFSKFSGFKVRRDSVMISSSTPNLCKLVDENYRLKRLSGSYLWSYRDPQGIDFCIIMYPTVSGMQFLERSMCRNPKLQSVEWFRRPLTKWQSSCSCIQGARTCKSSPYIPNF